MYWSIVVAIVVVIIVTVIAYYYLRHGSANRAPKNRAFFINVQSPTVIFPMYEEPLFLESINGGLVVGVWSGKTFSPREFPEFGNRIIVASSLETHSPNELILYLCQSVNEGVSSERQRLCAMASTNGESKIEVGAPARNDASAHWALVPTSSQNKGSAGDLFAPKPIFADVPVVPPAWFADEIRPLQADKNIEITVFTKRGPQKGGREIVRRWGNIGLIMYGGPTSGALMVPTPTRQTYRMFEMRNAKYNKQTGRIEDWVQSINPEHRAEAKPPNQADYSESSLWKLKLN